MDKKERLEVYAAATAKFGETSQIAIAIEEMGELIVALTQGHFRGRGKKSAIVEELADVYVVLEQLFQKYGEEEIWEVIDFKVRRLSARVNGPEEPEAMCSK